jgi:hypothetical protein
LHDLPSGLSRPVPGGRTRCSAVAPRPSTWRGPGDSSNGRRHRQPSADEEPADRLICSARSSPGQTLLEATRADPSSGSMGCP